MASPVELNDASKVKEQETESVDKYNVEAAEVLATRAQRMPIAQAAPIYEQLLQLFPTAAKFWKQYVEAYMAVNNDDATKQIFSRCLLNCFQVPLWRCYIRFIRKVNEMKGAEGLEETRKAFDFMLSHVGSDIASGPLWLEYITFLKSLPGQLPQEETQRMTALRKIYQSAIVNPIHHVEQLWREYEIFENSVNRQLAKGLISEYQSKYNSARAVYRERKKYVDEVDWNMLAVPPTGSSKEEQQWTAWRRLLAFERSNPQRIDSISSNKRIIFSYEQCLMYLYHYPDIWYDYATWNAKSGSVDAAIKVYQRALKALPDSELLKYAYAELEESRGAIQPAKKIYESILGDGTNANALAYIQFIRFLRRNEGVEAARKYFLDARKSPNCSYQVYVAYALMAFCLDKDPKIAHNVFEAGMKRFMQEPAYILEYVDFLYRMNDDRNIRALFERALSSLPLEKSVEVWKRFVQFEQTYGDLASMLKVEQRRKEAFSNVDDDSGSVMDGSLQEVVARYSFMDLSPCGPKDIDQLARQEWLVKNMGKKSGMMSNGPSKGASAFPQSVRPEKAPPGNLASNSNLSTKVVDSDHSRMVAYDPRQKPGPLGSSSGAFDEVLKATPPALLSFLSNLPTVEGPSPNVDIVLSICLQSEVPAPAAPAGQEEEESSTVQSQPAPPRDVFRLRQIRKASRIGAVAGGASQTGSTSYRKLSSMAFRGREMMNKVLRKVGGKGMPSSVKESLKKSIPDKKVVMGRAQRGLFAGKHIQFGNQISEDGGNKTRRNWKPNVQGKRLFSYILDRHIRVKVTTHAIRCIDKAGGIDEYLLKTPYQKMDTEMGLFWKAKIEKSYEDLGKSDVVFFSPEDEEKIAEGFRDLKLSEREARKEFRRKMYSEFVKSKQAGQGKAPVSYIVATEDMAPGKLIANK
ncbi:Cleavage stimulation factor subunit 77 [Linum grandiflorum]